LKKYKLDQILEKVYHDGLVFYSIDDFLEYFTYNLVKKKVSPASYRFQKIFDTNGKWVAMEVLFNFPEGLSAFDIKNFEVPTADLDLLIVGKLFEFFPQLKKMDKKVFINVFPSSLTDAVFTANFVELVDGADNTVVEVLEYKIFDRSEFLKTLETFKSKGVSIAHDDWGSESAGISRIVLTKPEFLKIDKSITWHRLGRKLVKPFIRTLKRELGIKVIVEGVDNPTHEAWAKSVGAHMQGYFLHKPEPLNTLFA
jgi:EAL domain-containing protein (putative c-di-GMP-specific phosphodiesterase class I)